jgi:spore germination protein YaaH
VRLETQHRGLLIWPRTSEHISRIYQHGDRITHVGLFFFLINSNGTITGAVPSNTLEAVNRWPHITWLLTVRNDGIQSIWRSLLTDQTAQDTFIAELHRLLDIYPWADGIDVDLEYGPNDLVEKIYQLYARIYSEVKGRGKHVHLDLPPMTAPYTTVGPEKWCAYERLRDICDTAQIMTYGFAWSGSAPGSTSPISWVRNVMAYAVQAMPPEKLFMGTPAFGYRWQIYDYPKNLGRSYRGYSGGYPAFLDWALGIYSHTDGRGDRPSTNTQPYIPFAAFYDEKDYHNILYLHIYDYPRAREENYRTEPIVSSSWNNKPFLVTYSKRQKTEFTGIIVDLKGTDYTIATGAFVEDPQIGAISPRKPQENEEEAHIVWQFATPAGEMDLVLRLNFPWFDKRKLRMTLDGQEFIVGNEELWYPYLRQLHWYKVGRFTFTEGMHTLELFGEGSDYGTLITNIRLVSSFVEEYYGGEAEFTLRPRYFKDINMNDAWPYQGRFKITVEALRRPPEYAYILYEDFRDWTTLPSSMYTTTGNWAIYKDPEDTSPRPYSWIRGSGQITVRYDQFKDVLVRASIRPDSYGRAGVFLGSVWLTVNAATGGLELYNGDNLVGTYNAGIKLGSFYTIAVRARGPNIAILLRDSIVMRYTAAADVTGACGIKTEGQITCDLFVISDSYVMMPREAVELTLPDGQTVTLGRIPRQNVTWLDRWGFFRLNSDVEEYSTRLDPSDGMSKEIMNDWDYLHSPVFTLEQPGDYPVKVKMLDVGVWLSTLYLGDADGFSIVYFPDAETILKFSDVAAYEFGVRGIGMWTIGQEDPQLWEMLVKHV